MRMGTIRAEWERHAAAARREREEDRRRLCPWAELRHRTWKLRAWRTIAFLEAAVIVWLMAHR